MVEYYFMVLIPLEKRLKKDAHRKVAFAQDLIINSLYNFFPNAVIHGGTAIWRCYGGKRFSEDIDVYMPRKFGTEIGFENFLVDLKTNGFSIRKFKRTNNAVFSKFELSGTEVRFEAVFKNIKEVAVKPFEISDGTFVNVYTLSPENLVIEKISAYKTRKKARDLYDIWFLLNLVEDVGKVGSFLTDFEKIAEVPKDWKTLRTLIILGAIPSMEDVIGGIRTWVKKNTRTK